MKKDYSSYNASGAKQSNLQSALDPSDRPMSAAVRIEQRQGPVESYTIPGRETKATK